MFDVMKRLERDPVSAGSRRGVGDAGTGGLTLETMSETGWDRFATGCEGVSQEQLVAFARGRWPTARLEPVQLFEHGEAVGGALIMIIDLPLGVGQVAICKNGRCCNMKQMPVHQRVTGACCARWYLNMPTGAAWSCRCPRGPFRPR